MPPKARARTVTPHKGAGQPCHVQTKSRLPQCVCYCCGCFLSSCLDLGCQLVAWQLMPLPSLRHFANRANHSILSHACQNFHVTTRIFKSYRAGMIFTENLKKSLRLIKSTTYHLSFDEKRSKYHSTSFFRLERSQATTYIEVQQCPKMAQRRNQQSQ